MVKEKLLLKQIGIIEEIMYVHNWTRKTIAKEIGVSTGSIGHWLNRTYVANPENMEKLETLLKRLQDEGRYERQATESKSDSEKTTVEATGTKRKKYSITASVTKEDRDKVHEMARQKGVSASELIYERVLGEKTPFEKFKSLFK